MAIPACPLSLSLAEDTRTNNLTNCVETVHWAKDKGINDKQMGKIWGLVLHVLLENGWSTVEAVRQHSALYTKHILGVKSAS